MKRKAPPFTWPEFHRLSAENADFDPFTYFDFHHVSRFDRGEIALRIIKARLSRAKPATETT